MRQLEEENLRLKKLVADLSLDKAMLQDVLAKRTDAGAPARMGPGPAGTLRGQRETGLFCTTNQPQLSATALWRQTTVHSACESGNHRSPGSLWLPQSSRHAQRGRAGGIITNAFTGSIANRVCPCVSNARGGTNRRSGDNRSLRGCIRTGVWGMDFVSDALFDGRRLRLLTVIDLYTRECLGILRGSESALNGGRRDAERHCAQTSLTTIAENR